MSFKFSTKTDQLLHSLITKLIRFFNYEWSGALIAIIVLSFAIELSTDGRPFLHISNIMTIFNNAAAVGVIAGGMTLVILTAGIDLSVGSVMGLIAALMGYVASFWGVDPWIAIAFGFMIAVIVGSLHGMFIAYWGMPAFIVTLAGLSLWRGIAHLSTGAVATPRLDDTFEYFGRFNPLSWLSDGFLNNSLPEFLMPLGGWIDSLWMDYFRTFQMSGIIFILFFVLLALVINNTKLGLYIYAIGSNSSASRHAGINTKKYHFYAYLICTLSVALGALLFLGRAPYAKSDYGQMWELQAIAAVVIGGTSLFGGRGSLWGTFMGIILLKLINNGLTLAQLETFWQMVVTGMIILIAIGLDIVRQSKSPVKIKQMLFFTSSGLIFFALINPISNLFKALIMMYEGSSMKALLESGVKLSATQSQRLISSDEISQAQLVVANNWGISLFLSLLILMILSNCFFKKKIWLQINTSVLSILAVVVLLFNIDISFPIIALSAVILLGALCVDWLFDYSIRLNNQSLISNSES